MSDRIDVNSVVRRAEELLSRQMVHVRLRDMRAFEELGNADKTDFVKKYITIYDCRLGSDAREHLIGLLRKSMHSRCIFSGIQVCTVALMLARLLPWSALYAMLRNKVKAFIAMEVGKVKYDKSQKNILDLRLKEPLTLDDASSNANYIRSAVKNKWVDIVSFDITNLVPMKELLSREDIELEITSILLDIDKTDPGKRIMLQTDGKYLDILCKAIENVKMVKDAQMDIGIGIKAYCIDSMENIEYVGKFNRGMEILGKRPVFIQLRYADVDFDTRNLRKGMFYTKFSLDSNFIKAVLKIKASSHYKEVIVDTSNPFLISMCKEMLQNASFCVSNNLNYPLFRAMKKTGEYEVYCVNYLFTNGENSLIDAFDKMEFELREGIFSTIRSLKNKKAILKSENDFVKSFTHGAAKGFGIQEEMVKSDFDVFRHETRKRTELDKAKSFLGELEKLHFKKTDFEHGIEFLRRNPEGDNPLENRLLIIGNIIEKLRQSAQCIASTIMEHTGQGNGVCLMMEEYLRGIVFEMIDCFKYYGCAYKMMFEDVKNLHLGQVGSVYVSTDDLDILEISSIIAANLAAGNVVCLQDSVYSRIIYYVLSDILKTCSFLSIGENSCDITVSQEGYGSINDVAYVSPFSNTALAVREIIFWGIDTVYYTSRHSFIKELLEGKKLIEINGVEEIEIDQKDVSSISIFSENRSEIDFLSRSEVSLNINHATRFCLSRGRNRTKKSGNFPQMGTSAMLYRLVAPALKNVDTYRSYNKAISAFSKFLSSDEIDFLQHIVFEYEKNDCSELSIGNVIVKQRPFSSIFRIEPGSDMLVVCLRTLISHMIQNDCLLSFDVRYFDDKRYTVEQLREEMEIQGVYNVKMEVQSEDDFVHTSRGYEMVISNANPGKGGRVKSDLVYNKNIDFDAYFNKTYISTNPSIKTWEV